MTLPPPSSHEKNIQKAGQRWQSEQSQTISISWMQSVGIVAFLNLSIALQAVVLFVKKLGDFNIADRMIAIREFGGQSARALADPSQLDLLPRFATSLKWTQPTEETQM